MAMRRALLILSITWNTIASQPFTNNDVSHSRLSSAMDCCPCPSTGDRDLSSDQDVSPSMFEPSALDDCPCRARATDLTPDSSFFSPALQSLRPLINSFGSKPDPKPLLKPEVGLASSVLETLREVTDEEYQDALARDAARNAIQSNLPMLETSADSEGSIINIILNPEDDNSNFDVIPEESHIQETRCIHSPLGSVNIIAKPYKLQEQNLKFPNKNIFRASIFDMDNSPSNVIEQVREPTRLHPLKKILPFQNTKLFQSNNFNEEKTNNNNRKSDGNLLNTKIPDLKLITILNNLKKLKSTKTTDIEKPDEHMMTKNNYNSMAVGLNSDDKYLKSLPKLNNNPSFSRSSWQPTLLKNLLKLKDVELIPATKTKQQFYDDIDKKDSKNLEVYDLLNNDAALYKSSSINKLEIPSEPSDIFSSPSNNNFISTLPTETIEKPQASTTVPFIQKDITLNENLQKNIGNPLITDTIIEDANMQKEVEDNDSETNIIQEKVMDYNNATLNNCSDLMRNDFNTDTITDSDVNENDQSNFIPDSTNSTTDQKDDSKQHNKNILNNIKNDVLEVFDNLKRNNEHIHNKSKSKVQNFLNLVKNIKKDDDNDAIQTVIENCTVTDKSLTLQDLQDMSDSILNSSIREQNINTTDTLQSSEITSIETINTDKNNNKTNTQYSDPHINNLRSGLQIYNKENSYETNEDNINNKTAENIYDENIGSGKSDLSNNSECIDNSNKTPDPISMLEFTPVNTVNEPEMNVEASERVSNRLLPANNFKSSSPKEMNNELSINDNNSYRLMIEKRLQEISDLLKLNEAACDSDFIHRNSDNGRDEMYKTNNILQSDSSNIVPKLQTRGENRAFEVNNILNRDLPRFHSLDNMKSPYLNHYKTRISSPQTLDRQSAWPVFDDKEKKISVNKLKDNIFKQNPMSEFVPTNNNGNNFRNSDKARNMIVKNVNNYKPKDLFNTLPHLDEFSDNLKSRAKQSFKNMQDAFESKLKSSYPKNDISHISSNPLAELSRKHSDMDKLQSWHRDLNDKFNSYHRNLDKALGSNSNNIPFGLNNYRSDKSHSIPKYLNKDFSNLQIAPSSPKLFSRNNEFKGISPYLRTPNKNIMDSTKNKFDSHKNNIGSDKIKLPDNILKSTAPRPKPRELYKEFLKRPSPSNPPQLFRSSFTNDASPLASEILPTRTKNFENIGTSKFSPGSNINPKSNDVQEVDKRYKTILPPKLPFKLKPERAPVLPKLQKTTKVEPSNHLVLGESKYPKSTSDPINEASENVKTISTIEEPLKENVSYKCKMVCHKDNN